MRRELLSVILGVGLLAGCGGGNSEESSADIQPEAAAPERPAQAASLTMQQDLLEISHLADVDHQGFFLDFGTPARHKYTLGSWGSGWGVQLDIPPNKAPRSNAMPTIRFFCIQVLIA